MLAAMSMAVLEIPIDLQTQKVALIKDDALSYGPSSHCALRAPNLFRGSV